MAVPTLLYAGMLMTENAFYPVFLLAALAMTMWLEKPDLKRTGFLLGAIVLAYLTRAQAVAILPALAVAPFLVSGRKALREFRWFFAAGAGVVLLVVVAQLARGESVFGVFGAYEVAGQAGYTAGGVSRWLLYALGGADPLVRDRPVRRAHRAHADAARPVPRGPRVRRDRGHALVLARARGRRPSPPSSRCGSRSAR